MNYKIHAFNYFAVDIELHFKGQQSGQRNNQEKKYLENKLRCGSKCTTLQTPQQTNEIIDYQYFISGDLNDTSDTQ